MSYDFNIPSNSFAGIGSVGSTLISTIDNSAGHPAKNRGVYFNGTDNGFIEIPSFTLYHTFSIHAWVIVAGGNGDRTIFSKDRNSFANTDENCLIVGIDTSGKLAIDIAKNVSDFAFTRQTGTVTLGVTAWKYVVFSVEMKNGKDSEVSLFINKASDTAATLLSDVFVYDSTDYKNYLAVARTPTSTFTRHWNGFIYAFHIY
jgi:hypothetical protein